MINVNQIVPENSPNLGQACMCGQFVYLRNYRAASTYYYNNFIKGTRWQEIEANTIDWDTKIVFSHIIDPIARRHKGITKWLQRNDLVDEYFNNVDLQNHLSNLAYIDNHSASIYHMLGDNTNKVNWILADYNDKNVARGNTSKFLASFLILGLPNFQDGYINASNNRIKELQLHIEHMFLKTDTTDVYKYFREDIKLFESLKNA